MNYLSHYTEQATTDLFNTLGAFWAFGDSQFNEQKKEGVKYVHLGSGLICPKENAEPLLKGMKTVGDEGRAKDLAENGKENIIRRELGNYECWYTGDIEDAVKAVSAYGFTEDEVRTMYRAERHLHDDF